MGSKSERYDSNVVQKLNYIHVMPVSVEIERGERANVPDSLVLTRMLAKELASRTTFRIVSSDTTPSSSPEVVHEEMGKVLSSGVVLFAHFVYTRSGLGERNAALTLKVSDPTTAKVMAYSSHDTFAGNSYFLPPSYEVITTDAIKGAVDELEKSVKKSK